MTNNLIDCLSPETLDLAQSRDAARMRYDLIVRARREIRAGRYDNDAEIELMLESCLDHIAEDSARA